MTTGPNDSGRGRGLVVLASGLAAAALAVALAVPSLDGTAPGEGAARTQAAPADADPTTPAPVASAEGSSPTVAPPASPAPPRTSASDDGTVAAAPSSTDRSVVPSGAAPTGAVPPVPAGADAAAPAPDAASGFEALAVGRLVPATTFGVHPSFATPTVPAASWRLWDTSTDWCALQPGSASQWRSAALDAQVARAGAAGVRDLVVVLGCTPAWAQRAPRTAAERAAARTDMKGYNTSAPPRSQALFSAYVTRLAAYLKPRVARGTTVWFQTWNEASLSSYWRGTPAEMAALTALVRPAVRKASAPFRVVAASTTLRRAPLYRAFWRPYLRALRAKGWPVDVFAIHSYPESTGSPATRRAYVSQALADLRAEGAPSRPVWDTELNFGLAGPGATYPFRPKTRAVSAAWLSRAYLDTVRMGLGRLYWYAWLPPGGLLGITLYTGSAGAAAYRTTAGWIGGATYRGCTVSAALVRCTFARGGRTFLVAWSEATSVPLKVPAGATRLCPADGAGCRAVRSGATIRVGALPVRLGA